MICGSGGSKSRLAKAAGAEPAGQTRDEKLHAVVARSTFRSEHVQNTPFLDHFWQLRCRKSARRCGPKHISKSKCTKHTLVGALLDVAMREAHFEVKMYKTHHDVQWVAESFAGRERCSMGRSDTACWMERKPWKSLAESFAGRERCSMGRRRNRGNSLGRVSL